MATTPEHVEGLPRSIFVGNEDAPVHDVPMSAICRPLMSTVDDSKVADFACKLQLGLCLGKWATVLDVVTRSNILGMPTQPPLVFMQEGTQLTPIELAWVEHEGKNYYFAFGGCHRWEAHKRNGCDTIPARLIKMPASTVSLYLGSSSPFRTNK